MMALYVGAKTPRFKVASLVLLRATLQGCASGATTTVPGAVVAAGGPTLLAWRHFDGLNALRAEGLTCPGGLYYAPNPEPLQFDCRLWRAAQLRLQDMAVGLSAQAGAPVPQAVVQLAPFVANTEDHLAEFKRSDSHCRTMMDPHIKLASVSHGFVQDQHYWMQMLSSEAALPDSACLLGSPVVPLPLSPAGAALEHPAPTAAAARAASRDAVVEPAANKRRLKPGTGAASAGDDSEDVTAEVTTTTELYQGPGQTFGMVLLIISMSIFCVCTFGSIFLGNLYLAHKARNVPVNPAEP